jgi:hypothetical protein
VLLLVVWAAKVWHKIWCPILGRTVDSGRGPHLSPGPLVALRAGQGAVAAFLATCTCIKCSCRIACGNAIQPHTAATLHVWCELQSDGRVNVVALAAGLGSSAAIHSTGGQRPKYTPACLNGEVLPVAACGANRPCCQGMHIWELAQVKRVTWIDYRDCVTAAALKACTHY